MSLQEDVCVLEGICEERVRLIEMEHLERIGDLGLELNSVVVRNSEGEVKIVGLAFMFDELHGGVEMMLVVRVSCDGDFGNVVWKFEEGFGVKDVLDSELVGVFGEILGRMEVQRD